MLLGGLGVGPPNRPRLQPHSVECCALVLSQVLHPPHCHIRSVHCVVPDDLYQTGAVLVRNVV